jgi:archaellum biogenesis protein FlaJ (TadC family)
MSALINSMSSMLFIIVYFKLCVMFFSGNKSRNWITIAMFVLINIDNIVGIVVMFSISDNPKIYFTNSPDDF